jgi:hypothetical protein
MMTVSTMEEFRTSASTSPEPVMPLDYGSPTKRPQGQARDLVLGIVISLLMGVGAGAITFGLLMSSRFRDEIATIMACGVTAMVIAVCLMITVAWLRFGRHRG